MASGNWALLLQNFAACNFTLVFCVFLPCPEMNLSKLYSLFILVLLSLVGQGFFLKMSEIVQILCTVEFKQFLL